MDKGIIKSIIALKQSEMPFALFDRDLSLPINRKKIITVTGVRRCGKSTMMMLSINELIKNGVSPENILWIGFDDERLAGMSSTELDAILSAYMEMFPEKPLSEVYMFFDEIQIIPRWEYFILRLYKSYCKNIYVCGSNATMLSTELNSALRGYPLEYKTWPLSFSEYCRFRGIRTGSFLERDAAAVRTTFTDFNQGGSFPEIVLCESGTEKLKLLQGYFDTMLLKDVSEHYGIANSKLLRYLAKRIMENLSKPSSILSIYNDIRSQGWKISKDELYRWAGYLCDVFMFVRIPKYEASLAKEQRSLNKYYCIDNGLRNAVLLPKSDDNGKLLENAVFVQLNRIMEAGSDISYYQGRSECDFVVRQRGVVQELIQVTWDMTDAATRKRELAGLFEASEVTQCNALTVITEDEETVIENNGKTVNVIPAWKWMLKR